MGKKAAMTTDMSPAALANIKSVAVWGASRSGLDCIPRLQQQGIEIVSFIDKTPNPTGLFEGFPVVESSTALSDQSLLTKIDAIILAIGSDSSGPKSALAEVSFDKPILSFREGNSIEKIFKGQLCVNHIFKYDKSESDRSLLKILLDKASENGSFSIYGAGKLSQYMFELFGDLPSDIDALLDDGDNIWTGDHTDIKPIKPERIQNPPTTILIASTRYLSIQAMKDKALRLFGKNCNITLIEDLKYLAPPELIPLQAWRKPENTIYPINIPKIDFQKKQDLILIDFPARFLGMMPNGLGYVHSLIQTTEAIFQTIDLDMIFYHRYHSTRILDGLDVVLTKDDYKMPLDPWSLDIVENEWSNPQVVEHFRPELEMVVSGIIAAAPKMIALSLHTTNLIMVKEVVARVRQSLPEIIVIVGGYDCIRPDQGPRIFDDFDYMVIFEAETSLPPLLNKLLQGEKPRNLPGVISKNDISAFPFVAGSLVEDLDSIDFPRYDWTEISNYRNYNGMQLTPIVLSRGCRWSRCTFCGERFSWRKRSAKNMVDEIEWLVQNGCRNFHFNDSDLSGDPQTVREVCEEIIARKLNHISLVGQLRVQKGYTPDYFHVLKQAGFSNLRYGIDGWSKNTLKLHRKGYTLQMIEDVIGMTKGAGISVSINLVIGIPYETETDIDETIENIISNKHLYDSIENINTLMLYNGSLYWEDPEKYDIVFHQDKELLFKNNAQNIPVDNWHSENPYIDQEVRKSRLIRIIDAIKDAGIPIGSYAQQSVNDQLSN